MLTRRHFVATSAALFASTGIVQAQDAVGFDADVVRPDPMGDNPWGIHPRFMPTVVEHRPGLSVGDLHVDPVAKYIYHIQEGGTAMRYGVAVGRSGLQSPGVYTIQRKVEWPSWTPTANMIAREPHLYAQFAGGVPGGPDNPLGARAMYLYRGGRDSYLRVHGTPQPWSIGTAASSGCVRLVNAHVIELYNSTPIGTVVHLHAPRYGYV
ncbi:L,D-transpeptidase family protein [Rhodobacterales bacterium HKCCE2091]|nr:L,D-transpeptidase family protein [Rhodobacterales bacterium HKCCE2091]